VNYLVVGDVFWVVSSALIKQWFRGGVVEERREVVGEKEGKYRRGRG
jgi:hypothetical protein